MYTPERVPGTKTLLLRRHQSSRIRCVLTLSVFEFSETRAIYRDPRSPSKVARRQVKIASRELVGSSLEHGINLAFSRLHAKYLFLEWHSRTRLVSTGADGRVVVGSRRVPNIIFQGAPLGASESKRASSPHPSRRSRGEKFSLDGILFESYGEMARTLHVARIAGDPGTAPL